MLCRLGRESEKAFISTTLQPINWPDTPAYQNAGLVGQRNGSIVWDSHTTEDDRVIPNEACASAAGDGTYLETQTLVQHNGNQGHGSRLANLTYGPAVPPMDEQVENAPKDMVTVLLGPITRIKATFDKPGRYVWHCHILSHQDHEMMRVLYVGPGAWLVFSTSPASILSGSRSRPEVPHPIPPCGAIRLRRIEGDDVVQSLHLAPTRRSHCAGSPRIGQ